MPAPTARTRGVTPGRKTRITLNYPVPLCISPLFSQLRTLDDISDPKNALNVNAKYLPGIGWRLTQYQETLQALHETSVADSSVTAGTAPSGVATNKIQRDPTELTGLGTTLLRASGDDFFQKAVAAGSTWAITDGTDQTSYPGPTTTQNVLLDRVFVGSSNMTPVEQFWFRFFVPGTSGQTPVQEICRFYFTSIPSNRGENYILTHPTGQYCIILHGDGNAYLWEKRTYTDGSDPDWILRMNEIRWCSPQNVAGRWHLLGVRSDAWKDGSNYYGSTLGLYFEDTDPEKIALADQVSKSIAQATNGRTLTSPTNTYKFQNTSNWQPTLAPIRVDVRRDTRLKFQTSTNYYYPTGTIYSKTFSLRHYPAKTTNPLKVTLYGSFPSGSSVGIDVYAADGTALTPLAPITTSIDMAFRDFTPIATSTAYFVKITLNSATGAYTPTVKSLLVTRDFETIYSTPTPTVIEGVGEKGIRNISISGEGRDFTTSTASFELNDVPGVYASLLDNKSGIPVRIDTYTVNEDLSENVTTLFEGRIVKAEKKIIGKKRKGGMSQTGATDGYAASKWGTYTVFCVGMWQTLFESTLPSLTNFASDPNSPSQPYRVGEAIQELFYRSGWPLEMVDVPDYTGTGVGANRFPVMPDISASLQIEPLSRVGQIIQEWARDFIGCYMVWDPNASKGGGGPMGMFRVLLPPLPTHAGKYRRLAAFRTTNTSDAGITTAEGRMATVSDYAGGTCKQFWIQYHSLSEYVEPPEGNYVIASGSGFISEVAQLINNLAGQDSEALVPRTLYNFPAADFGFSGGSWPAPDPTHPDYTDGRPRVILASNKAYQTQAAIDLVARRTFDFACHARKIKTFACPLWTITNPDDPYQVRPRPLRFGDIVTYDDVFYFVASAPIAYGFGEGQNEMMALTLMSIPALDPANGWVATNEMYKAIYSDKK